MGRSQYTTPQVSVGDNTLGGGLNSTAGNLQLQNNESSDLLNVDFDKFGSILKRNGYATLNDAAITNTPNSDGLYWYEMISGTRFLLNVADGKFFKMDSLDGTWDDVTGTTTITADYHCDFDTFMGNVYVTNGINIPWFWTGTGNTSVMTCFDETSYTFTVSGITTEPSVGATYTNNGITYTITGVYLTSGAGTLNATGSGNPETSGDLIRATGTGDNTIAFTQFFVNVDLEKAKFVKQYNNYLFFGNVTVNGTSHPNRVYWSNIQDPTTVQTLSFIEIARGDGQAITGLKVLADRLVIFKDRSIYNLFFTGDADIPFYLPGGGKSNSSVGCVAPWSIQEVENGLVFLAPDGIYYYDGNNSYKLSDRITTTLQAYNINRYNQVVSCVQRKKNLVYFSFPNSSDTTNSEVIVWNYFLNSFSRYTGMAPSAMTTIYTSGSDERPYFGDYAGFVYRLDYGSDDYPLGVQTAIDSYYWTNWRAYDDLISKKGLVQVCLYHLLSATTLKFSYSYDFETGEQFTRFLNLNTSTDTYGVGRYGTATYAGAGGNIIRVDVTGRGRVVRFKFSNSTLSETFKIDGFGTWLQLETNV